jgi:cytochrome c-type biogenesis protein
MAFFADLGTAFILGLLTHLTAVCVLPLYPGFLSYLSQQLSGKDDRRLLFLFGFLVTLGVILFMLLLGLVFTTILEVSLTKVIGVVSPIAFLILLLISIVLLFDYDIGKFLHKAQIKMSQNPYKSAFVYGFFFGAIVVPCNPAFIAAFFTRALVGPSFIGNMVQFLFFGIGIGTPLLIFSVVSLSASRSIIGFLTRYKSWINRISGGIMFVIAIYYLFFVFRVHTIIF